MKPSIIIELGKGPAKDDEHEYDDSMLEALGEALQLVVDELKAGNPKEAAKAFCAVMDIKEGGY